MPNEGLTGCIVCASLWLTGCGYPGEPLPPALNRPTGVIDLAAVEHGDKILVHFTVPQRTTEDLPLKSNPDIELRIGPMPAVKFETADWEKNSERVPVSEIHIAASPGQIKYASVELPAAKLYGKTAVIGVRVHGPGGRDSGWSNFEVLPVVAALPMPQGLTAKDAPDAVQLDWHAAAPGVPGFSQDCRRKRVDLDSGPARNRSSLTLPSSTGRRTNTSFSRWRRPAIQPISMRKANARLRSHSSRRIASPRPFPAE